MAGVKVKLPKGVSSTNQPPGRSSTPHGGRTGQRPNSGDNIDQFSISIDVDQTVQRLERELDDVTTTSPPVGGGVGTGVAAVGLGNYDDDILPGAAENMGSGNFTIIIHTQVCI